MNVNRSKSLSLQVEEWNFEAEVLRAHQPVLAAFWAPWSRPCQALDPVLEEVAAAFGKELKIVKLNADDCTDLSIWYDIQVIPTLLYVVAGTLRGKIIGLTTKEAMIAKLRLLEPGGALATPPESEPSEV